MSKSNELTPNTFFIEVSGAGIPEVDGLFVPSTAPLQNRNREPFQAQAVGTARWRGIEQTENPLAARHGTDGDIQISGENRDTQTFSCPF